MIVQSSAACSVAVCLPAQTQQHATVQAVRDLQWLQLHQFFVVVDSHSFIQLTPFICPPTNPTVSFQFHCCAKSKGLHIELHAVDRIRLNGKIAVLERGHLETGDKRSLTLFKNKYDAQDLRKNGNPAGRLLLINVINMVHAKAAQIEVDVTLTALP